MQESKGKRADKFFLIIVIILISIGAAMFISASLGVLARNESTFYSVLFSQLILGLGGGLVAMYICFKLNYRIWRKFSLPILILAIGLTAAVFIPGIGIRHGGAERWIGVFGFSLQPVELLKFAFVIYFAAWLSWAKDRVAQFRYSLLPLGILLAVIAVILFKQPDTKSFLLITATGTAMLFISGVPVRYVLGIGIGLTLCLTALIYFTPYLQQRVKTYIDPASDPHGASYQIQQSLIALGGGGIFGRGYGQSIQKFNYLPEPQGDSIFAVLGEEFGFVGAMFTIALYTLFALRGMRIANRAPDYFSGLLVSGIVIMITAQSFMHIAAVTGVLPLTGVPLPFMSHGGTSLLVYLGAVGILLNISKYQKVS